jgi:hypothetical protein
MFFLSYSSADGIAWIEAFFADLHKEVAQLLARGDSCDAFIATRSIQTGENWNEKISDYLKK